MKRSALFVIAAVLSLPAAQAQAADLAAAKTKYAQVCASCHGPSGKGMASFPALAGKDADYIASRLKTYRAGEKVGPNTPLMMPHAAELSDDQIAGLAAYVSTTFK